MAKVSSSLRIGDDGELRLLLLPVAQIDPGYNEDLGGAGWVISGIHIARDGRRVRYRVSTVPPDHPFASSVDATWIDAADLLHVFDPDVRRRGARRLAAGADPNARC